MIKLTFTLGLFLVIIQTMPTNTMLSGTKRSVLSIGKHEFSFVSEKMPNITVGNIPVTTSSNETAYRNSDATEQYKITKLNTPPAEESHKFKALPGEIFKDCQDCPVMVVIPRGNYTMGSPVEEQSHDSDEEPLHRVSINYEFAVGRYEVTWEEWEACVHNNGCDASGPLDEGGDLEWGRSSRPVINVNWSDAQAYTRWLSGKTGQSYRLLSEAEWEYVARAGSTSAYPWGASAIHEHMNYEGVQGNDQWKHTSPVGSFPANNFGLYDMHGNVWEWVQDCWHENYNGAPDNGSPWLDGNCERHFLRGGSWGSNSRDTRSATRSGFPAGFRFGNIGFRLIRTIH